MAASESDSADLGGAFTLLLRRATTTLTIAGVPDPQRDARRLLAFALGVSVDRLVLAMDGHPSNQVAGKFLEVIERRIARQPVSQIVGEREFYGRAFRVTSDVLDPRPDTETLVDCALERPFQRVLDLGTGSGCILLTLLAENIGTSGVGVDISEAALDVARGNAESLGLEDVSEFRQSDWFSNVSGTYDLIVSNPPYITEDEMDALEPEVREWEPFEALSPGGDGLSAYRVIAREAAVFMKQGGRLIVEIGFEQALPVSAIFEKAGFRDIVVRRDLNGHDRVVSCRVI